MQKTILITWHIPSYGIGFFKNVLSVFYSGKVVLNQKELVEGISQEELENGLSKGTGFKFDKVYYLYFSDHTSSKISDRTKDDYINGRARVELINDEIISKSKTLKIWEEVFKKNFSSIKEELNYVKKKYPGKYNLFLNQYWRNIHYYPITQQIEWFKMYSNASKVYDIDKIVFVNLTSAYNLTELRDEEELTRI